MRSLWPFHLPHDVQLWTYTKPKVEGSVLLVQRWILARLRNRRFFSLLDLR